MEPKICDVIGVLDVVINAHAGEGQLARVRIDGGAEQVVEGGRFRLFAGTGAELAARNGVAIDAVVLKTSPASDGSVAIKVEQILRTNPAVPGEGDIVLEDSFVDPITFLGDEAKHATTLRFVL
jgi:hypothetical protein